jgi:PAB1-binding protein PBP1
MNGKGNELVAAGSHWTTVTAPSSGNLRAEALMGDRKGGHSSAPPTGGLRGNIGEWDQFRANEELFNVQAKFDENLYTTELDKSAIDRAKIKEAERIAREIESTLSSNIHVAEERNQVIQGDYDEEDKYSGVLTNNLQARNKDIPQQQPKKMNYAAAAAKADKQKAPTAIAKNGDEGTAKKKGEPEKKEEKKSEKTKTDKLVAETKKEEPAKEAMAEEQAPIESIKQETKQVANEKPQSSIEVTAKQEEAKGTGLQASVKKEKEETKEDSADKAESAKKEGGGIEDVSSLPKEETKDEAEEKPVSEEPKKIPSKLNANAKEFTFNPGAKAFTPGSFGGTVSPPVPMQEPQIMIEPNTGMPMIPNNMHGHPQYMHPMGQHGKRRQRRKRCYVR